MEKEVMKFLDINQSYVEVDGELKSIKNKSKFKPVKKIAEMEKNVPYKILCLERIKTKYGEKIVAELPEYKLLLPVKYKDMTEKSIRKIYESQQFELK